MIDPDNWFNKVFVPIAVKDHMGDHGATVSGEGHIMSDYDLAQAQLGALESFKLAESNLPDPPVTMPQDRLRAAGIDPELWCGLGIVGIWGAMDAFAERKGLRGKRG